MRKLGILFVISLCAGVFLSYMGYFDKPETRVNQFFDAYNRQDVAGMLSMVDHPDATKVKQSFKLAGGISKVVSKAVLGVELDVGELLLDFLPFAEEILGYQGDRMYPDIQSSEWNLLRTEAQVHALVTVESEGESVVENFVIYLKKIDRTWYITDIQ